MQNNTEDLLDIAVRKFTRISAMGAVIPGIVCLAAAGLELEIYDAINSDGTRYAADFLTGIPSLDSLQGLANLSTYLIVVGLVALGVTLQHIWMHDYNLNKSESQQDISQGATPNNESPTNIII